MASQRIKGITIELGADASKFTKALAEVDKMINTTKTNLRDLDNALKLDPTNTALLKDKQRELGDQINQTKEKIQQEKDALAAMKNTEGFDANSKAARDLQTQIDLDESALKNLEKEAKQCGSVMGSAFQAAGQQIQEVGNKITSVGDSIANLGRDITQKVTVPIVGAFSAAVKTTADFDAQMSKVQAISGATGDEFSQLRDKAREMGANTKYSATEAGEAFEYMGMAGWKADQMLEGIPAILNLAAASGEELGTTSDIVTDALTAFGLKAEDAGRFADVLAAAATNANTNVSMMGESFKYVAPVAGSLGYSAEDVAIALGLMANSGIKADMAGTSLRNMFQRLAKPTKESYNAMVQLGLSIADSEGNAYSFREIMDQIRTTFADVNVDLDLYNESLDELDSMLAEGKISQEEYDELLKQINVDLLGTAGSEKARYAAMLGGTRAMSGLLAIANATEEDYNKLTAAIDGSSDAFARLADGSVVPLNEALASGAEIMATYNGQAEAMAATMQDNLTGDITVLKSQLQELAISFGDILMPHIRKVVGVAQEFVDKLNKMDDAQKEQIIKIAAVVAAIGPALIVIGKVIAGVGKLVTFGGKVVEMLGSVMTALSALSAPVLIIIAAIAALVAGFTYLYNTNEEFRNSVQQTVEQLKANFAAMLEAIQPQLEAIGKAFKALMDAIMPILDAIFTYVVGIVNGIIAAIEPIMGVVTEVINYITNIINAFIALTQGDFDGFSAYMQAALNNLINIVLGIIQAFVAFVVAFFNTFGINIKNIFTTTWNNIKTIVATVTAAIKTEITNKFNAIKSWLNSTLTTIKNKFNETFENIKRGVSEKIQNVKETIVNGIQAACDYIASLPGRFYSWGCEMIDSLINGIKEKIGGIAEAIGGVAETISSYIHFSEPDVGPLKDFHTFMPDMIKEMVDGINQSIPELQKAVSGMATTLAPSVMGSGASGSTTTNTVTLNIYGAQGQSVEELGYIIQENINHAIYAKEAVFR